MKTLIKTVLLGVAVPLCVLSAYGQTPQKNELQKSEWIKKKPQLYSEQGGQNEVVPEFNSKAEKEAWFSNNNSVTPNQILPNGDIIIQNKSNHSRQHVILADEPTFPVYVRTGNQQVDDQNYDQQKQNWINQNQNKYNSMVLPPSTPMSKKERLKLDLQPQN
jgi:hypothetical protein